MTEYKKEEIIFADGMTFQEVAPNAPESVRGKIWFQADKFIAFLNKHKNEKGSINVKMMKSLTKGSVYFILDTWKPNLKNEFQVLRDAHNAKVAENKTDSTVLAEDLPF